LSSWKVFNRLINNESAAFSVTSKSSSKKKRILIESSSKSLQIIDYVFRDWQYVTVKVCWSLNESEEDIVLDTECIMTIANHKFIEFIASNTSIQKMTSLISVWDIENKIHHFSDFVMLITYIHEFLSDDKLTTTCFHQKIHLINDFRVKILLEIDIMIIKKMQLDLNEKIVRINSCQEFTVNIFVLTRNLSNLKRIVWIKDQIMISSHALLKVFVLMKKNKLFTDRDLIFKSDYDQDLKQTSDLFTHVVNISFFFVQVWNDIEKSVIIQRHARIEAMLEYEEDDCFLTNSMNHYLMIIDWKQHKTSGWKNSLLREVSVLVIVIATLSTANSNLLSFSTSTVLNLLSIKVNSDLKIILQNNITIYDINQIVITIAEIVNFYDIWIDQENTVDISEKNWMSITLVSETKISSARVYFLSTKDKKLIDEIFDKLHEQHKLTWIEQSTLYNFSVFVVWRDINEIQKEHVVVDIQDLNKISLQDSYSMSLQVIVTTVVAECQYIIIIDVNDYFYQWKVRSIDRNKLIVVSHWKQKQFEIAVMRFKNSSSYVQHQTDQLLWSHWCYAQVYMNDIVIFSRTLKDHLKHLHVMFQLFSKKRVSISSKKSFIDYSSVILLNQKVDDFDLTISVEKLKTIISLDFSRTLRALNIYLDMIDWLRNYVSYYAQIVESLQRCKTELSVNLLKNNLNARWSEINKRTFESIELKVRFFWHLQNHFVRENTDSFWFWSSVMSWSWRIQEDRFRQYDLSRQR